MAFDIATEHVLHLADKFESFGTTATKHSRHLITAVSLHCQLSLAPLLQGTVAIRNILLPLRDIESLIR